MTLRFSHFRPDDDDESYWYDQAPRNQASLYPHNTYHGATPHHRAPLLPAIGSAAVAENAADFKPIRFAELQQQEVDWGSEVQAPSTGRIPVGDPAGGNDSYHSEDDEVNILKAHFCS